MVDTIASLRTIRVLYIDAHDDFWPLPDLSRDFDNYPPYCFFVIRLWKALYEAFKRPYPAIVAGESILQVPIREPRGKRYAPT